MGKDVDVVYTGSELFHLADNDLGYDGKIEARGSGAYAMYTTSSNWDDHVHVEVNKNGDITYNRGEGENHSWDHRQRDCVASILQGLSFEELQIVEAFSENEYLRMSAEIILKYNNFDEGPVKKYIL